jgi:hypothetical protein
LAVELEPITASFFDDLDVIDAGEEPADVRNSRALKPSPLAVEPEPVTASFFDGLDVIDAGEEHFDEPFIEPLTPHVNKITAPSTAITVGEIREMYADNQLFVRPPPLRVTPVSANITLGMTGEKADNSPPRRTESLAFDVTNDPSIASRTVEVAPAHTTHLNCEDTTVIATAISIPLPSFVVPRAIATAISIPPPSFVVPRRGAPLQKAAVALGSTTSRERPRPRPAYTLALQVRAEAKAKAAEEILKAAVNAEVIAVPDVGSDVVALQPQLSPPHSPLSDLQSSMAAASSSTLSMALVAPITDPSEGHGRRRRTLTQFGLHHAKEIEEKKARVEKLRLKRASDVEAKEKETRNKATGAAMGKRSSKNKVSK